MPELLTFIMTFAGHTPDAQRQASFYGDDVAQFAAARKKKKRKKERWKQKKVSGGIILVINYVSVFVYVLYFVN